MSDLLPCPFCGGRNAAQGASAEDISVWCFCGARGPSVPFSEMEIDPASKVAECRAAWNRRQLHGTDMNRILALVDHHVTDDDDRMILRAALKEKAMRELARLGQEYDAPEPTPGQIDLLCLSVQDVINGRLETGDAAADLAALKEHLDTALNLTGFDGENG